MTIGDLKILILGLNYAPEMVGVAVYTSGMAEALAGMGHQVHVIAGQPYYPQWRVFPGFAKLGWTQAEESGVSVIRCPHYVPSKPTGLKRVVHHLSFAVSALPAMLWTAVAHRPDIIISVAPSIIAAPVALLGRLVSNAKLWLHVQDLELEAAIATGLVRGGLAARLAQKFEGLILRSFDRVSSISPKMCERIVGKGVPSAKVVEVRNWAALGDIAPLGRPSSYRDSWNITTPHVALYSGNIGNKQGVELIVHAARLLEHRTDLTFVVCGEGPNRITLERLARGLGNILFRDLQPAECLNELLGLATVHLMPQIATAADLVLPSKLGNMMASGIPIVATAAEGTGLAAEVEGCGIVVPPGNASAFANAIEQLLDGEALRDLAGRMGVTAARLKFSKDAAIRNLLEAAPRATQSQ